jgi:hypothetical protein
MKFKHYLLFASLLCFGYFLQAQEPPDMTNCKKFRTGTFKYLDPALEGVTVKRTQKKQTETVGKGKSKKTFTFDIVWTSPANYTLTLKEVSDYGDRNLIGTRLNVQIAEVNGDQYSYVSYDDKGSRKEGKVKQVK